MASLRRRVPVGALLAVGLGVVIACGDPDHDEDDTQFRQDVIWCEEAVARLSECCGATFEPSVVECRHYYSKDTGCGTTEVNRVDPAFTIEESRCIHDTSCDRIVQTNVCQRATAAGKARVTSYRSDTVSTTSSSTTSTSGGSSAIGPVCP
ncbi:MAG: hypothetical protein KIT84_15025 [Labilithrix sp.]|nr:hypothetical protein [Labilithrix sp.]MCW5812336.1 hypothetical protein [Labilithrix sp.]